MSQMPRTRTLDSTIPLLREGYTFISSRCDAYGSDIFSTRLMLKRAYCVRGESAAEMFYQPDRFTRNGAMPPTTLRLLQDTDSVTLQDGDAHRYRKAMFMAMMTPDHIRSLVDIVDDEWNARLPSLTKQEETTLNDEAQEILCRAVCRWAGVPLSDDNATQRTREFAAMVNDSGTADPRNWRTLLVRRRTERWIRDVIQQARERSLDAAPCTPLSIIATHRDCGGKPLDLDVAAVELINVLRPTIAISRYIVFLAVAMHHYPGYRAFVRDGDDADVEHFVHEVRRFYPFVPFFAGRARQPFEWQGHHFPSGAWFLLDIYGTNHDARIWDEPQVFRPERFRDWNGSAYNFVPQGGGDHFSNHRCAGEWVTIAVMKHAARFLASQVDYDVPAQNLTIDLGKMLAQPESGFVITNIQEAG